MDCNLKATKEEFDKTRRACKNLIEHAIMSNHATLTVELTALAAILKQQKLNLDDAYPVGNNAGTALDEHVTLQLGDDDVPTSLGAIPQFPMPTSSTAASTGHPTAVSATVTAQHASLTEETVRASKHQRPISSEVEAHDKANRQGPFRQEAVDELRRIPLGQDVPSI